MYTMYLHVYLHVAIKHNSRSWCTSDGQTIYGLWLSPHLGTPTTHILTACVTSCSWYYYSKQALTVYVHVNVHVDACMGINIMAMVDSTCTSNIECRVYRALALANWDPTVLWTVPMGILILIIVKSCTVYIAIRCKFACAGIRMVSTRFGVRSGRWT